MDIFWPCRGCTVQLTGHKITLRLETIGRAEGDLTCNTNEEYDDN